MKKRRVSFSIGDVSSVMQSKWLAVQRFIETPTLFLLMLGDYTFHMVPKRALGESPRAADEFRALLRMKVQAPTSAFPGQGQLRAEQAEIAALRKEVARLKAERDILKKATAFFAREST